MFDDPGSKIKGFSVVLFWLATIGAVVVAFALGFEERHLEYPVLFFGVLIGGPIGAYISALVLVGFGELIEDVASVRSYCKKMSGTSNVQKDSADKNIEEKACWKCSCGRTNPSYTARCVCGTNKWDAASEK